MKLLLDFLPIALFFVAFKLADVYVATAVAIAASVAQIVWMKLRARRIEPMQWVSLAIIVVFGGMTLLLRDETFIKWKPTVLYGVFALTLAVGRWGFGRNFIQLMMGKQMRLPMPIWDRLNLAWILFFVGMAALNLHVATNYSTDTWVSFKLFGTLGLTVVFVILQALWFSRHLQQDES